MRIRIFPYVAAALMLQALAGCSDKNSADNAAPSPQAKVDATPATTPAADGKLILAFGDSLYAGYGVGPNESFPVKLQAALMKRGISASVVNAGVSGDTSAAGLHRLAFTLEGLPRKPDLAMINLGGNDMLRGIDPAETRANLTEICEELHKRGIPIVLTGMVSAPNMGRNYAERFNPIYAELARKFGAALYPFFLDGVITDRALMQADSIHPNPKGVDIIVGKVAPLVVSKLESK